MKKLFIFSLFLLFLAACGNEEIKESVSESDESLQVVQEEELVKTVSEVGEPQILSSSELTDTSGAGFIYTSDMLLDKDFSTAWCGKSGGNGDKITFNFPEKVSISNMGIVPGFGRDEAVYFQNNRIKKLKIISDSGEELSKDLDDEYKMHFLDLSDMKAKSLTFEIEEVYPGQKYDDTRIAEIDFTSDYVVNKDSVAAMNYYKQYKESAAIRPDQIVEKIFLTNLVEDYGYGGLSRGLQRCADSYYLPELIENDKHPKFYFGEDLYAFAKVNEYGREGDLLKVNWYYGQVSDLDNFHSDPKVDRWELISSIDAKVETTCEGKLYAYGKLLRKDIFDGHYYVVFPPGGGVDGFYKVEFLKEGKVIKSRQFYGYSM